MSFDISARKNLYLERRAARVAPEPSRHFLDAYLAHIDETPVLREAYALNAFWRGAGLELFSEDLIAGTIRAAEPAAFNYACGTWVGGEGADCDAVRERAYKYCDPSFVSEREKRHIDAHAASTTWFGGHMVLDYETVLRIGLDGYRADIARYVKTDFYRAMEVILDGITAYILRFAELAHGELAETLRHIAHKPPETFHQALQLVWTLHYLDNSDSFGRFDMYLLPFYMRDISNGTLTRDHALELLTDFWIKIEDANQIQNMTIGGTDIVGGAAYSDLTLLCLEVTRLMKFKGPNLCLRVTHDTPDAVWNAAMDCIGEGLGLPSLYHDDMYFDSLIRSGIPAETARNYCFAGCSQVMIPGQSNYYNDIGMFNAAKILELTLYGGYDTRTNVQVGLITDTNFMHFDELLDAYYRQLDDACGVLASLHNKEIHYRASREGYALRSLLTRGCIETGVGIFEGGARYNNVELEIIGITNAADSLYAIKKVVFDERLLTFAELMEILKRNWEGHEELREYCRSLPKFGNDYGEVDALRTELTAFLFDRFNREPAPLGGVYVPGEVIFTAHEYCGVVTGATPDGRYAGEVLADSAGAACGCSREGPTALMNSVLKLPVRDYLLTSVVLNMRFLPETFNGAKTREGVSRLLRGYFAQGGMQLQINVCDSETLRAAQINPELYGDLIVRVGGYSDYFIRLSKALQDEIIERAAV